MVDISHLFISTALAQTAAPVAGAAPAAGASSSAAVIANYPFIPFLLIAVIFYVLIIRPQQKKIAEQDKMVKALKRGDRVVVGGIFGKISKVEDDTLTIEIADGVNVKAIRSQVQALAAKTDTAAIASDGAEEKKG